MRRVAGIWRTVICAGVMLCFPLWVAGQQGELGGRVIDGQSRRPVPGATILLIGTNHQTVTDSLGLFRLTNLPITQYRLQVQHIAFGEQTVEVTASTGAARPIQIVVTAAAIRLEPLTVEALSADERRDRATGFRRAVISRVDIERAENTNMRFGDLLRLAAPNAVVRRSEVGNYACIELRASRQTQLGPATRCRSPAVFLDGVPVNNPESLYENMDLNTIESLEVVPVVEAGVMYGSAALYGAILITTRRPGAMTRPGAIRSAPVRVVSFNWNDEPKRHNTTRVFAITALGNGLGLAAGVSAAAQCIGMRKPAYDGIISDCKSGATIGTGAAAIVLPALASGLASRWSGRTDRSQGILAPAAVGTAMTIIPGYALVFSGYRNDSDALKWVGYGIIVVGAPLVTTAADYLFRELRAKKQ
jgi:hypothetical protein